MAFPCQVAVTGREATASDGIAIPDTEEVTGSNPVRPTRHFLFLALPDTLRSPTTALRARFSCQVAVKFLLKNFPWTWARQWTRAPDGGELNVNTLFFTVRHGTACGAYFAVSP